MPVSSITKTSRGQKHQYHVIMAFFGNLIMWVAAKILITRDHVESDARELTNREQVAKSSSSSQEAAIVTNRDMVRVRSNWQLQDAKARFSELVKRAREQGRS